eukprot:s29_g80.t1
MDYMPLLFYAGLEALTRRAEKKPDRSNAPCDGVFVVCGKRTSDQWKAQVQMNALKGNLTAEDTQRTQMYREQVLRKAARQQAPSFEIFLQQLQVRIDLRRPNASEMARVCQLSQRTNQMNSTQLRFANEELLKDWAAGDGRWILAAWVSDRYGDYGLVACAFCSTATAEAALIVDCFVLKVVHCGVSCGYPPGWGVFGRRLVTLRMDAVPDPTKPEIRFFDDFQPEPPPMESNLVLNPNRQICKAHSKSRKDLKRLQKKQEELDHFEEFLRRYHYNDATSPRRASVWSDELCPIHTAAKLGDVYVLRHLLAMGVDSEQETPRGQTALDFARQANRCGSHQEAVELLASKVKIVKMREFFTMMKAPSHH